MIDELINDAAIRRKDFLNQLKEISLKIDEEVRELGVPFVLPSFSSSNSNLPKQIIYANFVLSELDGMKSHMINEKDKLYKACNEMYKEELDGYTDSNLSSESAITADTALPSWIHELFTIDASFTSVTSVTSVNSLDAAIDNLDPFIPTLSDSLAKFEAAHKILTERLEMFRAEFEVLWKEIGELFGKLYPFSESELTNEMITVISTLNHRVNSANLVNSATVTRSKLKRVKADWKRIEKDRTESISGSILLIGRLWNLLETPHPERFHLDPFDLSLDNINRLSQERHRLINFQQQKFKELYDSQVQELKKLMTALKWSQSRQDSLLKTCQCYTADGLQFLSIQLATLQPKLELSLSIIDAINSRYSLIGKMREFEKSASDPARLFRSSFQLLQEEKFRKTALPSLLNIEGQLKGLLHQFKSKFGEDFVYEAAETAADDAPAYVSVLEDEISGRFMSSGIFGFDQSKQRKERIGSAGNGNGNGNGNTSNSTSNSASSTPRYTTSLNRKQSSSPPLNTNTNNNVIPQRRKLDK